MIVNNNNNNNNNQNLYIAPYIFSNEIALKCFTNIIKCKTVLHEHSTLTHMYI